MTFENSLEPFDEAPVRRSMELASQKCAEALDSLALYKKMLNAKTLEASQEALVAFQSQLIVAGVELATAEEDIRIAQENGENVTQDLIKLVEDQRREIMELEEAFVVITMDRSNKQ